jgi:transcription antitermination factor NusG
MDDFLSDEDEWDILDDETLKKTIDDVEGGCSAFKKFDIGDNVEAVSGQYKSIKGNIVKILPDNIGKISSLIIFSSCEDDGKARDGTQDLDQGPRQVL